jgi:hypothetical protein
MGNNVVASFMQGTRDLGACGLCSTDCALFLGISLFFGYKKGWLVALVAQSRRIIQQYYTKKAAMMDLENWRDGTAAGDGEESKERPAEVQIVGVSKFDLDAKTIGLDQKYVLDGDECGCILVNEQVVDSLEG